LFRAQQHRLVPVCVTWRAFAYEGKTGASQEHSCAADVYQPANIAQ
jgi:hypothetical protein